MRSSSNNSYHRGSPSAQQQINDLMLGQGVAASAKNHQRNNVGAILKGPPMMVGLMMRSEGQGGDGNGHHSHMHEKYQALLNKNLEESANLAKTLRNTKVHIYDKLRNSYQNANQLMQRGVLWSLFSEDPPCPRHQHDSWCATLKRTRL